MKVFLTGASSGIGEALAAVYAERGATLGLVARRGEQLETLRRSLRGEHEIYACDVRDAPALKSAAEHFIARRGVPDVVIGNAGISRGAVTGMGRDDLGTFRETFDTNLLGLVHSFDPFIGPMRAARRGKLVGIASVAGFRGLPGSGAYSASKAAAICYLEALRVELRGSGVGVTTICPGYIATPMTARNPYRMPFLLRADEAARRFVRAIDAGKSYAVIPWQMAIVGRLMRLLPNVLFDPLAARAGRKPRDP